LKLTKEINPWKRNGRYDPPGIKGCWQRDRGGGVKSTFIQKSKRQYWLLIWSAVLPMGQRATRHEAATPPDRMMAAMIHHAMAR